MQGGADSGSVGALSALIQQSTTIKLDEDVMGKDTLAGYISDPDFKTTPLPAI